MAGSRDFFDCISAGLLESTPLHITGFIALCLRELLGTVDDAMSLVSDTKGSERSERSKSAIRRRKGQENPRCRDGSQKYNRRSSNSRSDDSGAARRRRKCGHERHHSRREERHSSKRLLPGSCSSEGASEAAAEAQGRPSQWSRIEETHGPKLPFAPSTPEAARLDIARAEVARCSAAGQIPPAWLTAQVAHGNAAQAVAIASLQEASASREVARKAALAQARRAAPPPPWMVAKAVFSKPHEPLSSLGSADGRGGTAAPAALPTPTIQNNKHCVTDAVNNLNAAQSDAATGAQRLDLSDRTTLEGIQQALAKERSKLRCFIIRATQEADERKERSQRGPKDVVPQASGETEGDYYTAVPGELFGPNSSYKVEAPIGRGVFSSVFKCKHQQDNKEYAVKFIRSNGMMRRAAEKEAEMYRRFAREANRADAEGARHLINLAGCQTCDHAGHLCLVFNLLRCDMRLALQRCGKGSGLPLLSLAQYGRQIFCGLRVLRQLRVIHADLKPDNLLLTPSKAEVQICDFGSAMDFGEIVRVAYAQPRYYRAPEVILGLPYDSQIDMWSAGATLFELATGRVALVGKTNNVMLKQMIEVCGGFTKQMARDGEYSRKHFSKDGEFLHQEPSVVAASGKPKRSISSLLQAALTTPTVGMDQATHNKWVMQFADLVAACLRPDPSKRIEPRRAVSFAFFDKPNQAAD